jgi:GntR family transcriptional regulator
MRQAIDKASPLPYYHQLREILQAQIERGDLPVGTQVPSEPELCAQFDVSRTVVRQALGELAIEGIVTRLKGKGTFVAGRKQSDHLAEALTGLHDDVVARGEHLDDTVLRLEQVPLPPHVARLLEVDDSAEGVFLERLRSVGGGPYVLTRSYMRLPECTSVLAIDMRERSLYDVIQHDLGLPIERASRTIEAGAATAALARMLDVPSGSPLLILKSVAYLADGRPIEYFIAWHRGDRSRFEVHLNRKGAVATHPSTQRIVFDPDGANGADTVPRLAVSAEPSR